MYTVYILYSKAHDRLYIGYTSNLIKRFHSHNGLSKRGYTARFRPWEVVHVEFFDSKSEAMAREKSLKSGSGREWIHKHIPTGFISAAADGSSNLPRAT